MTPEAEEFVHAKMDEVREALAAVESMLINGRDTLPNWRDTLADLTDEFHTIVHNTIGLFGLSSTPGLLLGGEQDEQDVQDWSRFDAED